MTHPEEKPPSRWITFSRTRSQVRHNVRKELIYVPPLIMALAIIALWPSLFGLATGMFVAGFVGLIMIKKQEMVSSMIVVRGKPAIVIGVLWVLLVWGIAIIIILGEIFGW